MKTKLLLSLFIGCLYTASAWSQTLIWSEDFSSYANGTNFLNLTNTKWYTDAHDADDGGINNDATNYWGVYNGEFRVNDIEGTAVCGTGGDNDNFWYSEVIDVSAFPSFTISMKGRAVGDMECGGGCNAADMLEGSYQLDNGTWVSFFSMCGATNGTVSAGCIQVGNAHSLRIRVQVGTQANGETYYFDDIKVLASPQLTGADSISAGTSQDMSISATGGIWSSSNSNIATIDSNGKVTAISEGSCIISYLLTSGCSISKTLVVTPVCVPPTVSTSLSAERCGSGTLTLKASGTASLNWYDSQSSGTILYTGTDFVTPTLTADKTYYVEAANGSCKSTSRTAVTASISSMPTLSVQSPIYGTLNQSMSLSANTDIGSVYWYDAASNGNGLNTGLSYNTGILSAAKSYFVQAVNGSCKTAMQEIRVFINNLKAEAGSIAAATCHCSSDTVKTVLNADIPQYGSGTWTVKSKPVNAATPTFDNINDAKTTVSTYMPGTYCLKWTVADSYFSVSDSLDLVIEKDTIAPSFNEFPSNIHADYGANCKSYIPNLETKIRATVSDNCCASGLISYTQHPAAGNLIESDTELKISISDLCGNTRDTSILIEARHELGAELSANTEVISPTGADVELKVKLSNASASEQYIYEWTPAVSTSNSYTAFINKTQSFKVNVKTTDGLCSAQSNELELKVPQIILPTLIIPGSLSRTNREFGFMDMQGVELSEYFPNGYFITIYNRYGQIIAELKNQSWDGNYNGRTADAGVYFYTLNYVDNYGQTKLYTKSSLELIKK